MVARIAMMSTAIIEPVGRNVMRSSNVYLF
jgi:hypothetical protein